MTMTPAAGHEGTGRAGFKRPAGIEFESEFYTGKGGYLHGGLGIVGPVGDGRRFGIVGHFVREETGGEFFPSLGAEYIRDFGQGRELEVFSFGYFPVEKQHAWALGARVSNQLKLEHEVTVSPFFGPAYARVQAMDEATGQPATIGHFMLLGGVEVHAKIWNLTFFGTHSTFSRDPAGLETHVDLEEMTHFAAYENNDGFAQNTAGLEISCSPTDRLTFTARYAWIHYPEDTRHSITFAPALKFGKHLQVFAGVQLLRGGKENDLAMVGVSRAF